MNLKEYLFRKDISRTDFAKLVGVTRQTIYKIICGTTPTLDVALKIEEVTNGEVKCKDLLQHKKTKKENLAQD